MVYLLDANVLIQAKNLHYGFDFCLAFWDWFTHKNNQQIVFSIEAVRHEIMRGDDRLSTWIRDLDANFFQSPDRVTVSKFSVVAQWANDPSLNYQQTAINEFLSVGDYFLVCHALGHGMTVVTHEIPSNLRKRIKIPDACRALGVQFMSPFEMLRRERANFVLGGGQ
ncbi:DUF4411 family protein [Synechocystis salina LEGE 06155]|nr:DUF4411 family protein [Synechocystis salina LEGE 06155]